MANGDNGSSGLAGVLVGVLLVVVAIMGFLYFSGNFGHGPSKSVSVNVNPPAPNVPK
jgi:hypothetical protein